MITLITICHNRIEPLSRTLKSWLQIDVFSQIVIVTSHDNLLEQLDVVHIPKISVVCQDLEMFNLSKARNIGAQHAKNKWLFFCDVDIQIFKGFRGYIQSALHEHGYHVIQKREQVPLNGFGSVLICESGVFNQLGGFDEHFTSYGFEDDDFIKRLSLSGLRRKEIPWSMLKHLDHPSDFDYKVYRKSDLLKKLQTNKNYLTCKLYYMVLSDKVVLTPEECRMIREKSDSLNIELFANDEISISN